MKYLVTLKAFQLDYYQYMHFMFRDLYRVSLKSYDIIVYQTYTNNEWSFSSYLLDFDVALMAKDIVYQQLIASFLLCIGVTLTYVI